MKAYFTPMSVVTLSVFASSVQGHGFLSQPKATFKPGDVYTNFVATTSASINKGFDGGVYNHEPVNNAKQFAEHWSATGYSSLREMLDTLVPGCGNSDDTAPPVDVSSFSEMWWQNNEYKEGFLESHHVYKNCVPISNGGSGTSTSTTASRTTGNESYNFSMTESTTTTSPQATTAAPQSNQWGTFNTH
eukprot:jgi/Phyca11/14558/fgenesh1_pg.PHYCAscaffold_8_\